MDGRMRANGTRRGFLARFFAPRRPARAPAGVTGLVRVPRVMGGAVGLSYEQACLRIGADGHGLRRAKEALDALYPRADHRAAGYPEAAVAACRAWLEARVPVGGHPLLLQLLDAMPDPEAERADDTQTPTERAYAHGALDGLTKAYLLLEAYFNERGELRNGGDA